MEHSRRSFLKSVGLGFVALGLPPTFLVRAAGAEQNGRGKVLRRSVPARRHGWAERRRAV